MASSDRLEKSISTIKYFLFCLDIVIIGLGVTVLVLSVWLWREDEFSSIVDTLNISVVYWGLYIIILKCVLVIIVSFLACASALLEHVFFLLLNSAAQLVLFVLGLIGTAVLLSSTAVGSSMQSTINSSMVNIIFYYPNYDWANGKLSQIQESVGCCGGSGPKDYVNKRKPLPTECRDTVTGNVFFYGCMDEITWYMEERCYWITALTLLLCFFHVGCCGGSGPNDYVNKRKPLPTECRDTVTGNVFFYGCMDEITWYMEERCYWITALTLLLCFFHVMNAVLSFILLQAVRKEEEEAGSRYK